ncbi:ty3-gypsy retrotransposon protein [Tanacetum coccineum]
MTMEILPEPTSNKLCVTNRFTFIVLFALRRSDKENKQVRLVLKEPEIHVKMEMEILHSSIVKFITACSYSIDKYKDMMKAQMKQSNGDNPIAFKIKKATKLEYLGHIISCRGVEMDPKKVATIVDWPLPKTQWQVRGFLGVVGYYRRFIKDYVSVATPLTSLLQKYGFKWEEGEVAAFDGLKHRLSRAPILGLPNFDDTFIVVADASLNGIGTVLLQKGQSISFFSHHKSIKELMQQVILTPIQQKYVRNLMMFDFAIEYKPGVSNQVADALSRMYEDDNEGVTAAFMVVSLPVIGLVDDLKSKNGNLEELGQLHQRLERCEQLEGFCRNRGLLQPLPTPTAVWEGVSMDFITGLPASKDLTVILVVVDRFSKYAHFGTLPTTFNAPKVAELFMEIVVKHHGFPKTIVSDRDPIFPPSVIPYPPGSSKVAAIDELLVERDDLLRQLKKSGRVAGRRTRRPSFGACRKSGRVHPVFHVSILKLFSWTGEEVVAKLPEEEHECHPLEQPLAICDSRLVLRNGLPTRRVLVQWVGSSPEEVAWEWLSEFQATYTSYHLEDKVIVEEEGNVTPTVIEEEGVTASAVEEE